MPAWPRHGAQSVAAGAHLQFPYNYFHDTAWSIRLECPHELTAACSIVRNLQSTTPRNLTMAAKKKTKKAK
jgi:hypothetical protein